jgi:hypothetical protein
VDMKGKHHRTHYFGTAIMILILLSAVIGMYYAFSPAGKAYQMAENIDTIGYCCCKDSSVFKVPSKKLSAELMPSDCAVTCFEHNSDSMGQC